MAFSITLFAGGCGRDGPLGGAGTGHQRVDPAWVIGEAAASLDSATGRFRLTRQGRYLDAPRADSLAQAFLRTYVTSDVGSGLRGQLEQDRGGPISWGTLTPCGEYFRAKTAYGDFPASVPTRLHRSNASQWSVPFCAGGTAQLAVSVADFTTSLAVEDGQLSALDTDSVAGVFTVTGVPARYLRGQVVTPEEAVAFLFSLFRVPIVAVPTGFDRLSDAGIGQLPLCSSWQLALAEPVAVREVESGLQVLASEILVARATPCFTGSLSLFVASDLQPTSRMVYWPVYTDGTPQPDSAAVPMVGPSHFARVGVP